MAYFPPLAPAKNPYRNGFPTVQFNVVATTSSIRFGINNACLVASLATLLAPSSNCFANVCGAFSVASRTPFFARPLARAAIPPVKAISPASTAPSTGNPINPLLVTSIPAIGTVSASQGLIPFCTFCIMSYFSAIDGSFPYVCLYFSYSFSTKAPIPVPLDGSIHSAKSFGNRPPVNKDDAKFAGLIGLPTTSLNASLPM